MEYALVDDGILLKIVDENRSEQLSPTIFRSVASFDDADKLAIGAYPVKEMPQPIFDASMQSCVKDLGALIDGVWLYQWVINDLDAAIIAENMAEKAQIAAIRDVELLAELQAQTNKE
jgi:hypothetical protein